MNELLGPPEKSRRAFLFYFSSMGLSATLLPGVLWSRLQDAKALWVTAEDVGEAAEVAGARHEKTR